MTNPVQRQSITLSFVAGVLILLLMANYPALREAFAANVGFLAFNHIRVNQDTSVDSPNPALFRYSKENLEQAVRLNPSNTSAWRALGYLLLEAGSENEALDAWRHVNSIAAELYENGAQAETREDALGWYKRAVSIDPELVDAWLAVGFIYEEWGDMESAEDIYLDGLEAAPHNSDLLYYLSRVRSRMNQQVNWETILDLINQAIVQDNYLHKWSLFQSYYLRGEALRNLNRKQEAWADYNVVLEGLPNDYWSTLRLAELSWDLKLDMKAAEAYYQAAITLNPKSKWAYRNFARDLAAMGRTEEARALFEQVLGLDPDDQLASEWLRQHP
jgi:tetratricopeptide (TPR) repeat protein